MKSFVLLILLMLGTLFLTACGRESQPTAVSKAQLELVATDIAFDKDRFEVLVGQSLEVTLQNEGVLVHDFSIMEIPHTGEVMAEEMEEGEHDMSNMTMEPQVHMAIQPGGTQSLEFTPAQVGEYEFFCTVAGHKEAGMVGTLVVKDS